jgi:DNA mismatch repair protein MutS
VFLHKILPGRSDRSYGIQVARLAGLPPAVIARARDILNALEHDELSRGGRPTLSGAPSASQQQLGLFQTPVPSEPDDRLRERIREVDLNRTTPLEALQILSDLKSEVDGRTKTATETQRHRVTEAKKSKP